MQLLSFRKSSCKSYGKLLPLMISFLFLTQLAKAQLSFVDISPSPSQKVAFTTRKIELTFSVEPKLEDLRGMDASNFKDDNVFIEGSQSGLIRGNWTVNGTKATFEADKPFYPGEEISVSLTKYFATPLQFSFQAMPISTSNMFVRCDNFNVPHGFQEAYNVQAADMNNDGLLDLVVQGVFSANEPALRWFENMGDHKFKELPIIKNLGTPFSRPVLTDLNRDGFVDVLVETSSEISTLILANNGDPNKEFVVKTLPVNGTAADMIDLDLDGKLDVIQADQIDGISPYYHDGDFNFSSVGQIDEGDNDFDIKVVDIDLDGDMDFLHATDKGVVLYERVNNNPFADIKDQFIRKDLIQDEYSFSQMHVADVDGDGDKDLLVYRSAFKKIECYLLDKANVQNQIEVLGNIGSNIRFHVVDLNADGKVEILYPDHPNSRLLLITDILGGSGGNVIELDAGYPFTSVTSGDIDNDGDLDILATVQDKQVVFVYKQEVPKKVTVHDGTNGGAPLIPTTGGYEIDYELKGNGNAKRKTFTIRNVGSDVVRLGDVTISNQSFKLTEVPASEIPVCDEATFSVDFVAATTGEHQAEIRIFSEGTVIARFDVEGETMNPLVLHVQDAQGGPLSLEASSVFDYTIVDKQNDDLVGTGVDANGLNMSIATVGSGEYLVNILSEDYDAFWFRMADLHQHKLLNVVSWGDFKFTDLNFEGCNNLTTLPAGAPDISQMTSLHALFKDCYQFDADLSTWNVSGISDFSSAFEYAMTFNQPLDSWDVSSAENMAYMFKDARKFDQPIGSWETSNVTRMDSMFFRASVFNQDINTDQQKWDVSKVTSMAGMFDRAFAFNQDLNSWDVSRVTNMARLFRNTSAFNGDISGWDVSNVTDMNRMFNSASVFEGGISEWDVSNVTDMTLMFSAANKFDDDLSNWEVGNVTGFTNMFSSASVFNSDISGWDVSLGSDFTSMFYNAQSFDQDLGDWELTDGSNLTNIFQASGMTVSSFDATFIGWSEAVDVASNITLGSNFKYCRSEEALDDLISTQYWTMDLSAATNDCVGLADIDLNHNDGQNTMAIPSGSSILDFGETLSPAESIVKAFNLKNTSSIEALIIDSITVDGDAFSVEHSLSTVNPSEEVAFTITYNHDKSEIVNGTVKIYSNAINNNPYVFYVTGATSITNVWDGDSWSLGMPDGSTHILLTGDFNTLLHGDIKGVNLEVGQGVKLEAWGVGNIVSISGAVTNQGEMHATCRASFEAVNIPSYFTQVETPFVPAFFPTGKVTHPYETQITALGYNNGLWSVDNGNLPNGLTLESDGTISGTPTEIGVFNITFGVTEGQCTQSHNRVIVIEDLPSPQLLVRDVNMIFGEKKKVGILNSRSNGEYSYSVSPINECVQIDESTGEITLSCAGPISEYDVRVIQEASTNYRGDTADVKLNLYKAEPVIEVKALSFLLDQVGAMIEYETNADSLAQFELIYGEHAASISIDGEVTPLQEDSIQVEIYIPASANYYEFRDVYTFNIYQQKQAPVAVTDTVYLAPLEDTVINILDNDYGITSDIAAVLTDIDHENKGRQQKFFKPGLANFILDDEGNLSISLFPGLTNVTDSIRYTVRDYDQQVSKPAAIVLIVVDPGEAPALRAPEIITPNGDGFNDTFVIGFTDLSLENIFQVYDRSGNLLLEIENYQNDWDGTLGNGDDLDDGHYFFAYNEIGGQSAVGNFEILRQ